MTPLLAQALKYLGTAVLSAGISLGLPALLHEVFGVSERMAVLATLVFVFLFNFLMLRRAVFNSTRTAMKWQSGNYLAVSIVFRVLEYLAFLTLFDLVGIHYLLSVACVQVVSTVVKFFVYRSFVFAPMPATIRANNI